VDVTLLLARILLALLLYAFLGVVVAFLWQDLRQTAGLWRRHLPEGRLVVVATSKEGPEMGSVFPLLEVTSIGRTPTNTIVVPDHFVSANHALLTWREKRWWLQDQGSRNGTTLNGALITQPTVVSDGDMIGVGRLVVQLEINSRNRRNP
jgi:hypothetical protein